jgi:hypothetical protein
MSKLIVKPISKEEKEKILKMHADEKKQTQEQVGRTVSDTLQKPMVKPVVNQTTTNDDCLSKYGFKFTKGGSLPFNKNATLPDYWLKENFQFKGVTYTNVQAVTYMKKAGSKDVNFRVSLSSNYVMYGKWACKDGILYLVLYPETKMQKFPGDYGF